jgi:hypothetical protein
MNSQPDQSESLRYPRIERLWRDVGDESPWYEKALFHAIGALNHGDPPTRALDAIERELAKRELAFDEGER